MKIIEEKIGKKNMKTFRRVLRPLSLKILILTVICQILQWYSCDLYTQTLEGGDLNFIIDHIAPWVVLVLASEGITIFIIFLIYFTLPTPFNFINWGIQSLQIMYTITHDLGTDLEHHGQYNFIAYILIWAPIFIFFIIYRCCRSIKRAVNNTLLFWVGLIGSICFSIIYLSTSLEYSRISWYDGLGGDRLIMNQNSCSIEVPGYPWISVLPDRFLNFFSNIYTAGSSQCTPVSSFSSLEDGLLTINCDSEALIIEQPDFISMRDDIFVLKETGMEIWKDKTEAMETRYTVPGKSKFRINSEWFQVFCNGIENFYTQNVKNQTTINRLTEQEKQRTVKPMNIVVFMFDTVSRVQFHRKMRKTADFLENLNKTGNYEVFEFFKIMTNGFSTEQNTKAMYTGSQLRQNRSGRPYWDIFRGQGNAALYINGFCEDWMSTFLKKEFQGLDHAVFFPWCHFEYHPIEKTFGNFQGPFSMVTRCLNGKVVHKRILNYIDEFWLNYRRWGKVVHVPFQEGHEGSGEVILTVDPDIADFLSDFEKTKKLNDTIIILTSDHGSHMGPYFMFSETGKYEQRMPLLLMIYPQWFLKKYPEFRKNLIDNKQRLISHYDTYWTFRHLATLPEFGGEIIDNFKPEFNSFSDPWDCEENLKNMEIIYMLKEKSWSGQFKHWEINEIHSRIEACFKKLNHKPRLYENVTIIPIEQISGDDTLDNILLDLDAKYWFEDVYMLNRQGNKYRYRPNGDIKNLNMMEEEETWKTLEAQGNRYYYGRSLLKYADDRSCHSAGIRVCLCNN